MTQAPEPQWNLYLYTLATANHHQISEHILLHLSRIIRPEMCGTGKLAGQAVSNSIPNVQSPSPTVKQRPNQLQQGGGGQYGDGNNCTKIQECHISGIQAMAVSAQWWWAGWAYVSSILTILYAAVGRVPLFSPRVWAKCCWCMSIGCSFRLPNFFMLGSVSSSSTSLQGNYKCERGPLAKLASQHP